MIDHDEIRARLKTRMEHLGLAPTGKWLKENGIGQTTIRNFVDGTNMSLTVETITKLARPLKISEQWLLFGHADAVSELDFREMAEIAAEEIQVGMRIEEIRNAVASALHDQLKLHLAAGGGQGIEVEANAPGTDVPPRAPTKGGGQATPRTA